jgi:hypothetical protein
MTKEKEATKMTYREFFEKVKEACIKYENDYTYIGVRFEDKERTIGEICERSKHNPAREDDRDFPEYGTPEYDELPTLRGTSAWLVYNGMWQWASDIKPEECRGLKPYRETLDDETKYMRKHAYVIAGNRENTHCDCDDNEIVIEDAVVIDIIY